MRITGLKLVDSFLATPDADLFAFLLLKHWGHPKADDQEYLQSLLDAATEILHSEHNGFPLGLPEEKVDFVALLAIAQQTLLQHLERDEPPEVVQQVRQWIERAREWVHRNIQS